MTKVIGVRFRTAGKIYFFAPGKLKIQTGDKVIVETARGVEFGTVVTGEKEVEDDKIMQPLKPVIRIATAEDKKKDAKNRDKEKEAFGICLEKIRKHGLEMKLLMRSIHLTITKCCFILRQMEELISVSWSRTWQLSLRQESNFARSE